MFLSWISPSQIRLIEFDWYLLYLKIKQTKPLLSVWEGAATAEWSVHKRAINNTVWSNTAVTRTQTKPLDLKASVSGYNLQRV